MIHDPIDLRTRQLQLRGDASYEARAADASHSSLLRVSTKGGIAIAAWCVVYFVAEFLR